LAANRLELIAYISHMALRSSQFSLKTIKFRYEKLFCKKFKELFTEFIII